MPVRLPILLILASCAFAQESDSRRFTPADERALLRAAGEGFTLKRTPVMAIAYDTPDETVDALASRLAHTYHAVYRFCEALGLSAAEPEHLLEVIFFDRREAYDAYAESIGLPAGVTYGVYYEQSNRSAFFNMMNDPQLQQLRADIETLKADLDDLQKQLARFGNAQSRIRVDLGNGKVFEGPKQVIAPRVEKELESRRQELHLLDARRERYSDRINETVIQHETAHQVLFNVGVHVRGASNPRWLVEGLACLFESPPSARGTGIGRVNQLRLQDFRAMVGEGDARGRLTGRDLLNAIIDGRVISVEQLVSESDFFATGHRGGAEMYAMAWALTHYLQRRHGAAFSAYLSKLQSRRPSERVTGRDELKLFEKHFGLLGDEFVVKWGNYIFGLTYRPPERIH